MLRLHNISKSFDGVKALQDVSLAFRAGEVHAVCGENGAGKSTLMNIIAGNLQPDEGEISWQGKKVTITSVAAAHQMGIAIVYQERSLAEALSIAENIFPVNLPVTARGLIDYKRLRRDTAKLLGELELQQLSPKTIVRRLSPAQKQMVEIAKAVAQQPSLLILDEPTASLTHSETDILFRIINKLKAKGAAIVYVSHRMAEISVIADSISVLKDGKYAGTVSPATLAAELIRMMVGRELETVAPATHAQADVVLEVKGISGKGFYDINFDLHKGEILGLAGLEGSGRGAVARALFGDTPIQQGKVIKRGKNYAANHPAEAIGEGVVYLTDDRKAEGLFLDRCIAENLVSAKLTRGEFDRAAVNKRAGELVEEFGIKTRSISQQAKKLSGGNQQKLLLAKYLDLQPGILLANEPTHGVDVGSKADIYRMLQRFTAAGKSVLLISSELPELLLLCDRIAVMYEGKLVGIMSREEASEEKITRLASGISGDEH